MIVTLGAGDTPLLVASLAPCLITTAFCAKQRAIFGIIFGVSAAAVYV